MYVARDPRPGAAHRQRRRAARELAAGGPEGAAAGLARPGAARRRPARAADDRRAAARRSRGDGAWVRCAINTPATVGRVLRERVARAGRRAPADRAAARAAAAAARAGRARRRPVRTLSYSRLAAWKACGYRYYLQRVLGLPDEPVERGEPEPPRPALDARTRGSLVHALLEHDDADPRARSRRAGAWSSSDEEIADVWRLAARVRGVPARAAARARAQRSTASTASRVPLGDTLLTGIVDVLAHERGGRSSSSTTRPTRWTRRPTSPPTSRSATACSAASMRSRRCAAERRASRSPTRSSSARASRSPRASTPPTPTGSKRELLALAAGLLAGEYPVTPAPHRELCLTCPGRRALCSYDEEQTLRPAPAPARLLRLTDPGWRERVAPVAVGGRAPSARRSRPVRPRTRRARLAVDDAVELGAEEERDARDVQPQQQDHRARERAVRRAVLAEVRDVEEEADRGDDPDRDADEPARAEDPPPPRVDVGREARR